MIQHILGGVGNGYSHAQGADMLQIGAIYPADLPDMDGKPRIAGSMAQQPFKWHPFHAFTHEPGLFLVFLSDAGLSDGDKDQSSSQKSDHDAQNNGNRYMKMNRGSTAYQLCIGTLVISIRQRKGSFLFQHFIDIFLLQRILGDISPR